MVKGISDFGLRIVKLRDFRFEIAECRLMETTRHKEAKFSSRALSLDAFASLDSG